MANETIEAEKFGQYVEGWLAEVAAADMTPAMDACGEILRREFSDHFLGEYGPNGPWPERKVDVGVEMGLFPEDYDRPLLVLFGDLYFAAAGRGPGAINIVEAQQVTVGVQADAIEYAAAHQYGTTDIPARPYIWARWEAVLKCEKAVVDYFVEHVL